MSEQRCLYCYQELNAGKKDFHAKCNRNFFGTSETPELPFSSGDIYELAKQVVKRQVTVPGVQPKLSLDFEKRKREGKEPLRLTIVGLWGRYILKPPIEHYPNLPELEDLTMHLGALAGIKTVPHSLIRLRSGELAYLTKRVDRTKKGKLHMEDMCQLTEKLTEQKYRGSYEQIGRAIVRYSANPILDLTNYFEQVIFSFLTGNADMHLKNFSLLKNPTTGYALCPAYDLVSSALVVKGDDEELALTLNGKKRKLKRQDFEEAMQRFSIDVRARQNIFFRIAKSIQEWKDFIDISFLPERMKTDYQELITHRTAQIEL